MGLVRVERRSKNGKKLFSKENKRPLRNFFLKKIKGSSHYNLMDAREIML